jgi:hypothetical protein
VPLMMTGAAFVEAPATEEELANAMLRNGTANSALRQLVMVIDLLSMFIGLEIGNSGYDKAQIPKNLKEILKFCIDADKA